MHLIRTIGLSLPNPLLEELDRRASAEGVSRSQVARALISRGLLGARTGQDDSAISTANIRRWRPRMGRHAERAEA
jgi:metal-responsive CopG/Arc/MetJ family transcriptional regulator